MPEWIAAAAMFWPALVPETDEIRGILGVDDREPELCGIGGDAGNGILARLLLHDRERPTESDSRARHHSRFVSGATIMTS